MNIQNTFRVTHNFHPSPESPNLYEATVTITNITGDALNQVRYRRVMDWDIEPTASSEYVTIQGGNTPELPFDSNDGLASANPLAGRSDLGHTGNFTDEGAEDHGALFDFDFGRVEAGQSVRFSIFYGAAANGARGSHRDRRGRCEFLLAGGAEHSGRSDAGNTEHLRLRVPKRGRGELRTECRRRHSRHRAR